MKRNATNLHVSGLLAVLVLVSPLGCGDSGATSIDASLDTSDLDASPALDASFAPDGTEPTDAPPPIPPACPDAGPPTDGGICPGLVAPRPVSPTSTGSVTTRRPTFRWELAPASDGARVQVCSDRACTNVVATFDASGSQGAPPTDLPTGVLFWRAFAKTGTLIGATAGTTWQLRVPPRASRAGGSTPNTSWGTMVDVDGDGYDDAVAPGKDTASRMYVYAGSPSGLPTSATAMVDGMDSPGGYWGTKLARVGDVDGDGYADILTIAPPLPNTSTFRLELYRGGPSGLTSGATQLLSPQNGAQFAMPFAGVGDVNRDGYADVMIWDTLGLELYSGSATGLVTTPTATLCPNGTCGGSGGGALAGVGDVDGDGFSDVAVSWNPGVALLRGGGSGLSTTPAVTLTNPSPGLIAYGIGALGAGDVNGDGFSDFMVAAAGTGNTGGTPRVLVYLGSSSVSTTPAAYLPCPNGFPSGVFTGGEGDVNGDGFDDVLVASAISVPGPVFLFLGSATGPSSIPAATLNPLGRVWTSGMVMDDFDRDGYADVLVADIKNSALDVFRGSSSGISTTPDPTITPPQGTTLLYLVE